MIENNNLDKSFGPAGTSAGIFLVLVGVVVSCIYPSALVLTLIGAFVGLTGTSARINYKTRQVKFCNNIFGLIPLGKWLQIDPSMQIGIRESNLTYRAYSRGDRALDTDQHDFRLVLLDSYNREIMPLKKSNTLEVARMELEMMSGKLELTINQIL